MDKKLFFDKVRASFGKLSQAQVSGIEFILDEALKRSLDLRFIAYILATVWHETAKTMQPIREYGSDRYLKAKKYFPFYGRGYVQITWKENYAKYGIEKTPDKALEPLTAREILFDGMLNGRFTGKKLSDFAFETEADFRNARRIVNGTDKADLIASYAKSFLGALQAGSHSSATPVAPTPSTASPEPTVAKPEGNGSRTENKGSVPLQLSLGGILVTVIYLVLKGFGVLP